MLVVIYLRKKMTTITITMNMQTMTAMAEPTMIPTGLESSEASLRSGESSDWAASGPIETEGLLVYY